MKSFGSTLAVLLLAGTASALDVEIASYSCDDSYPMTADIYMACADGTSRCTFGEQVTVYGQLHYNGVANSGINADTAYMSAELSLFSIDFSLVNKQAVPLCYFAAGNGGNNGNYDPDNYMENDYMDQYGADQEEEQQQEGEQGQDENDGGRRRRRRLDQENVQDYMEYCPYDGSYPFSVDYVLPSAGTESASWLASGWTGSGIFEMYAQRNDQTKIGECTLVLNTFVTKKDDDSLVGTPSAAATAGIIVAVIFATFLMCFYCYCCIKTRKGQKERLAPGDDVTSSFRRMEEDDVHSKPGTINIDAESQAASKKSAKEML